MSCLIATPLGTRLLLLYDIYKCRLALLISKHYPISLSHQHTILLEYILTSYKSRSQTTNEQNIAE